MSYKQLVHDAESLKFKFGSITSLQNVSLYTGSYEWCDLERINTCKISIKSNRLNNSVMALNQVWNASFNNLVYNKSEEPPPLLI